jgi:hypothetical protein
MSCPGTMTSGWNFALGPAICTRNNGLDITPDPLALR